MKLGDKITFNRYVKRNNASVDLHDDDIELPYELVRIDEITLPGPLTGIICGKRKIVKSTQFDFGDFYSDGYKQHNTEIQVYLVATRMDGFYRVPIEWVDGKCEM